MTVFFLLGVIFFFFGWALSFAMGTRDKGTHNLADICGGISWLAGVFFTSTSVAYWLGW
jgi:hypothetical protein